jgi:dienelactone hydrolase
VRHLVPQKRNVPENGHVSLARIYYPRMPGPLDDYTRESFTDGGITHDIYRAGTGPAVIVIAEIPGITPKVVSFANRVRDLGCTAVLPHLFGTPERPPSTAYVVESISKICVAKEFSSFALGRTGQVVSWLRALARKEHERCGGPGVGAVGMCYTGGFGLAMAIDDSVIAPVLSQPSLPFPVSKSRRSDIQLSNDDWARIQKRASEEDLCVIGLRFTGDKAVPPERFRAIKEKLGDNFIAVELDSSPGNPHGHPRAAHSVLTEHLDDRPGTPTRDALDQVLEFFRSRLVSPQAAPA